MMRFDQDDKVRSAVSGWAGVEYVLLSLTGEDGAEKQVLRRMFLPGEDRSAATSSLPRSLDFQAATPAQLYGMLIGGQRVGRLAVKVVPDRTSAAPGPPARPHPSTGTDAAPPGRPTAAVMGVLGPLGPEHAACRRKIDELDFDVSEHKDMLKEQYTINTVLRAEVDEWKRRYEGLEAEVEEALSAIRQGE